MTGRINDLTAEDFKHLINSISKDKDASLSSSDRELEIRVKQYGAHISAENVPIVFKMPALESFAAY